MLNNTKRCLAAALLAFTVLGANSAFAKVFSIPSDDALGTVNIPDDWSPNPTDNGVEANAPDGTIYLSVDGLDANSVGDAVKSALEIYGEQGLQVDPKSLKEKDFNNNGVKVHSLIYQAKDEDGDTEFSLNFVETRDPHKFLMVTFWGSTEAQKANDKAVTALLNSIQLTK